MVTVHSDSFHPGVELGGQGIQELRKAVPPASPITKRAMQDALLELLPISSTGLRDGSLWPNIWKFRTQV